jgi:hypothetical protein
LLTYMRLGIVTNAHWGHMTVTASGEEDGVMKAAKRSSTELYCHD